MIQTVIPKTGKLIAETLKLTSNMTFIKLKEKKQETETPRKNIESTKTPDQSGLTEFLLEYQ